MVTTVKELLDYHFSRRSLEEQLKIFTEGPPRPSVQDKTMSRNSRLGRLFVNERFIYSLEMWLCGSEKQNTFFCWTCLLFVKKETPWSMSNDFQIKELRNAINRHKRSADHFSGMHQYFIFQSKNNLSDATKDVENEDFSRKEREVLERIIDTVCVMVSQISPKSIGTDYSDSQAHCLKLLHLIKTCDDPDIVDEACDFVQKNPRTVTDLMDSLAILIKKEIKEELKLSTFASVILNGHSDVRNNLIVSIMVRYVNNGRAKERLVGFASVNSGLKTKISEFVIQLISELGIAEKFLSISADGVVLPKDRLKDFLIWMMVWHPKTLFVPCHFHEFHSVLQQSLSSFFPECEHFFRTLRSLKEYFESSPQMCTGLRDFCRRSSLDISNLKMSDTQFLRVLRLNRHDFVKFFEFVTFRDSRKVEDFGFASWLQDCQTVFLLELFFTLFAHTAFINEMFGSNSPEGAFDFHVINSALNNLQSFKECHFVKVCSRRCPDTSLGVKSVKKRLSDLFVQIVQHVIHAIELRLKKMINLGFLGVLDFENRAHFTPSDYLIGILARMENKFISTEHLLAELRVLGEIHSRKSVHEVLEFLHQHKLDTTFKNLFRLAEYIATLPCKPLPGPNSKLDSINEWTSCLRIPENMSLMCVEEDILEYLKSLPNFCDKVLQELKLLTNKPK